MADILIVAAALALVAVFVVSAVKKARGKSCGCKGRGNEGCGNCTGCGEKAKHDKV